jgi:hypothetical protein
MFVVERGVEQGDLRIGERETDAGRSTATVPSGVASPVAVGTAMPGK